jgi:hypothetical protein
MGKRYAWKIFKTTRKDGTRESAFVRYFARMEYPLNTEVTSPRWLRWKGYYPTVFTNLMDAERYLGEEILDDLLTIEKVEVGEEMPLPPMMIPKAISTGGFIPSDHTWPPGTAMVRWVKRLA